MDVKTEGAISMKIRGVAGYFDHYVTWTEGGFKLRSESVHALEAFSSKSSHHNCMIGPRVG